MNLVGYFFFLLLFKPDVSEKSEKIWLLLKSHILHVFGFMISTTYH